MLIITLVNLVLYLALFGLVYYLVAKFIPIFFSEIIRVVIVVILILLILGMVFKIPNLSVPLLVH